MQQYAHCIRSNAFTIYFVRTFRIPFRKFDFAINNEWPSSLLCTIWKCRHRRFLSMLEGTMHIGFSSFSALLHEWYVKLVRSNAFYCCHINIQWFAVMQQNQHECKPSDSIHRDCCVHLVKSFVHLDSAIASLCMMADWLVGWLDGTIERHHTHFQLANA